MEKNPPNECKHIIKDNYYCINCGTLCHNKVRIIKFLIKIDLILGIGSKTF
jgi:hypothetical protein